MSVEKVHNVAIIGAGISGVVSAAHLLRRNINVTVFERNSSAGGVWYGDHSKNLE
jgi:cation diffusion facilitator CzcD-associated flavoprotein CzcO